MSIVTLFNSVIIFSVLLSTTIHCQTNVALDVLQKLNSQIDAIAASNDYGPQITALNNAITDYVNKEQSDFQSITTQLDGVSNNVDQLQAQVENTRRRVNVADDTITQLQSTTNSLLFRIGRLENVTMVWKANFNIVNGTFAQLAKKFKIFTPTITLIRIPIFSFI